MTEIYVLGAVAVEDQSAAELVNARRGRHWRCRRAGWRPGQGGNADGANGKNGSRLGLHATTPACRAMTFAAAGAAC
jgi:hypothetical protein